MKVVLNDDRRTFGVIWQSFRRQPLASQCALPLCLLLAGILEGIGLTFLLPLAIAVAIPERGHWTGTRAVLEAISWLGLPLNLSVLLTLIVMIIVLKAGLLLVVMRRTSVIVADIAAQFRLSFVDGLLAARWHYFTRQPAGRLANTIAGEADRAAHVFFLGVNLAADIIQAFVFLGFAAYISLALTGVAIAVGTLTGAALYFLVQLARAAGQRQTTLLASLAHRFVDAVVCLKPLSASERKQLLRPFFVKEIEGLRRSTRELTFAQQAAIVLQEPLLVLGVALVLIVATRQGQFDIPAETMLALGLLLYRTAGRITNVQRTYVRVVSTGSALTSLQDTIDGVTAARETATGTRKIALREEIRLEDVWFSLDGVPIIRNLSATIAAGKLTAITGPSGVGKTTLVDLLAGLHSPQAGKILIDGVPMTEIDLSEWRRAIGYVPQDVILFNDSLFENIRLYDEAILPAQVEAAANAAGLSEVIAGLPAGLATPVGERGGLLSGGQRQRVALARALVHDPALIILDEATTALDRATEAEIVRRLLSLPKPLTIIAISHQAALIEAADDVIVFSRVADEPEPDQICARVGRTMDFCQRPILAIPGSSQQS